MSRFAAVVRDDVDQGVLRQRFVLRSPVADVRDPVLLEYPHRVVAETGVQVI